MLPNMPTFFLITIWILYSKKFFQIFEVRKENFWG